MLLRDVTINDIAAFVLIARYESFALAAEELRVTQSALSRRIKKLENSLGAPILDRTTRSVAVSTLGLEFLPQAIRIVEDFNRSLDDVNEIVRVRRGVVTFSCNMTISDTLLPDILERFKKSFPDIRIRVHEDSSPQALEKVLNGQSELAFAQLGEVHPELEFEKLINDRFVIVCHKDHPLAKQVSTTWNAVKDEQFILLRAESGTRKILQRNLGELYDVIAKDMQVGHFHSQLALAARGIGIAAVPSLIRLSRKELDLASVQIGGPTVSRNLGVVTYRGRTLSPAAQELRQIAAEIMNDYNEGRLDSK